MPLVCDKRVSGSDQSSSIHQEGMCVKYPKEIVLRTARVNHPAASKEDEPLLRQFYSDVRDDRWYMRYDITDPAVIRGWEDPEGFHHCMCSGRIVAHARLHLHKYGCYHHQGRLHHRQTEYRQNVWAAGCSWILSMCMGKGLGAKGRFRSGSRCRHRGAYNLIFKAVLEDFTIDRQGQLHDLMIMTKRLHRIGAISDRSTMNRYAQRAILLSVTGRAADPLLLHVR
jgi:hypothetical protein